MANKSFRGKFPVFKFLIRAFLSDFYRTYFYRRRDQYILSRTACLGNHIVKKVAQEESLRIVNFQKSRADSLVDPEVSASGWELIKLIHRPDVLRIVIAQRVPFFFKAKPNYVIFDSFSELTDQKFYTAKGRAFYCNYSDVSINPDETCLGLLPVEELDEYYDKLFAKVRSYYGNSVPVVFIHFSTALDQRVKFNLRSKKIKDAISRIEKKYSIFSVEITDSLVECGGDGFCYHFSDATYECYLKCFRAKVSGFGGLSSDRC